MELKYIVIIGLIMLVMLKIFYDMSKQTEEFTVKSVSIVPGKVINVIQADIIKILIGTDTYMVRLIGVDAPESNYVDKEKNRADGKLALGFAVTKLKAGMTVYLQMEKQNTDSYGYPLRYMWLSKPLDIQNESEIREKMYNAILILEGFAKSDVEEPNIKYKDMFEDFEAEARVGKRGLWFE